MRLALVLWTFPVFGGNPAVPEEYRNYAQTQFTAAEQSHARKPDDVESAWQFARACYDLAEFATNRTERAALAQLGIETCKQVLTRSTNCPPAHYYFGLNLGQLARTKGLGALKLVGEMRQEFTRTIALDERFDYAGAHRGLGLLYRDAPAITSLGNRGLAQQHLQRAVTLEPQYPENLLCLIEGRLKWGELEDAQKEFNQLEEVWSVAKGRWEGPAWASAWADWDGRRQKLRKKLDRQVKPLETPRNKP